ASRPQRDRGPRLGRRRWAGSSPAPPTSRRDRAPRPWDHRTWRVRLAGCAALYRSWRQCLATVIQRVSIVVGAQKNRADNARTGFPAVPPRFDANGAALERDNGRTRRRLRLNTALT